MLDKEFALRLMRECADSLLRSGMIESPIDLAPNSLLYGDGANLDSIGFVTFVTGVEELMNEKLGGDRVIALLDIDDFDDSAPMLTVDRFADYLVRLAAN
jgi:acyl carrier protein